MLESARFADAKATFQKVRDSKKDRGAALLGLGHVAFQQGDYPGAAHLARQALDAATDRSEKVGARILAGDASFKLQRFKDAEREYEAALKLEPGNAGAKRNLELAKKRLN